MQRGKILVKPASEGAPWELEREGVGVELDAATLVLHPDADGSYRVFALRFEVVASVDQHFGVKVDDFECKGLIENHKPQRPALRRESGPAR